MSDLQKRLLPILKWFHEFCESKGLRYYAIGGTTLGAIRHKGFIPWDDDVDVAMPREDYEKFIELTANKTFEDKYVCEFPIKTKEYYYAFGKVYDKTTTLVENKRHKQKKGVYLDIFPLEGLGTGKENALKHFKRIDGLFNRYNAKTCAVRKERSLIKNLAIIFMRCIPEFIYNTNRLMRKLDRVSKKYGFYESEYVCNAVGAYHEKEVIKREIYGQPIKGKFEDIEIYLPSDCDKYLTALYGDYMQPPPIEKQVSHHDFVFLDLGKGYLD